MECKQTEPCVVGLVSTSDRRNVAGLMVLGCSKTNANIVPIDPKVKSKPQAHKHERNHTPLCLAIYLTARASARAAATPASSSTNASVTVTSLGAVEA